MSRVYPMFFPLDFEYAWFSSPITNLATAMAKTSFLSRVRKIFRELPGYERTAQRLTF